MASVVRKTYLTYDNDGYPNFDNKPWPHKGDIESSIIGNGAFWITSRERFEDSGSRISVGNNGIYEMPQDTLYEVDTLPDWAIVETLLKRRLHG